MPKSSRGSPRTRKIPRTLSAYGSRIDGTMVARTALVASSSFDGGMTWGTPVALPFSACAGGTDYERASDPWVSIGPDGTAYAVSISFNQSNNSNAVLASVSKDGGQT